MTKQFINHPHDAPGAKADNAFIHAGHAMYEALCLIEDVTTEPNSSAYNTFVAKIARAAISKAEGRA